MGHYERVPSAASRWSGGSASPSTGGRYSSQSSDGRNSVAAWSDTTKLTGSSGGPPKQDELPDGSTGLNKPGFVVKQRNPVTNIKALGSNDIAERGRKLRLTAANSSEPLIVDDSDLEDDEEEWEEISNMAVPLTVSLGIIGLYIIGGAVLFKYWEGWDMAQSGYFCFITLSTIGFGDVTPGRDYSDPNSNAKLIMGSIYSIFGMAILSMCFTLMQEEMLAKFNWIGKKLGVVENEDDHDDQNDREPVQPLPRYNNSNNNQSEC